MPPAATTTAAVPPFVPTEAVGTTLVTTTTSVPGGPTININIQLELPPSKDAEVTTRCSSR